MNIMKLLTLFYRKMEELIMDIVHVHTTSQRLSDLPVVNGQLIVLDDISRMYYDMNGVRHDVSSGSGSSIQVPVIETASSANVGNIVQYIGATDQNYTNGYFYKCVEDNSTYSWIPINVQAPFKLEWQVVE